MIAAPELDMSPAEILLDLEEIKQLKARYCRYQDTKQWEAFRELFTADASLRDHSVKAPVEGREALVKMVQVAIDPKACAHHVHTPEIELLTPTTATGIWALADYSVYPTGMAHGVTGLPTRLIHGRGYYVEEYLKVDGEWKIQKIDLYWLDLEIHNHVHNELTDALRK